MLRTTALVPTLAALLTLASSPQAAAQVTVSISCSSLGTEQELCQSGADAWAKETGNQVKLVSTPADANERLALYQQLLAAGSADIDVFQIDVVWPGILANHFVDLKEYLAADDLADHFEALVANNTVDDQPDRRSLLRRCRPALLPQGSAREIRQAAAADLGGARRRGQGRGGRRACRRQRADAGLCLPGPRL